MKLLIVRHGECVANALGVAAGSEEDSPLTEKGQADARAAGERLKGVKFDAIAASPLQRAHDTARIIRDIAAPNALIEIIPDFTEFHLGDATGMDVQAYYELEKTGQPISSAETHEAIFERVKRGLETLNERPEKTVLLVAHNGIYRMIVCVVENLKPNRVGHVPGLHNGEIKEVEI